MSMQIFIKLHYAEVKYITLEVMPLDYIGDVCTKIKDREGVPVEIQSITYRGRKLDHMRTLSDYNVQREAQLVLVPKRGGGKIQSNRHAITIDRSTIPLTKLDLSSIIGSLKRSSYGGIELNFAHCQISKEDHHFYMTSLYALQARLVVLNLDDNDIVNITPLSNFINLETLSLHTNQIKDIKPLEILTKLSDLSLHRNEIQNMRPLLSLTNLTKLNIAKQRGCHRYSNFYTRMFATLKLLHEIHYDDTLHLIQSNSYMNDKQLFEYVKYGQSACFLNSINHFNRYHIIPRLTYLRTMDLSNNFITDVFPLGCCIELNELDLSNNNVRDIQPLIGLHKLKKLNVSKNLILNIEPLHQLSSLKCCKVEGNPIEHEWRGPKLPLKGLERPTGYHLEPSNMNQALLLIDNATLRNHIQDQNIDAYESCTSNLSLNEKINVLKSHCLVQYSSLDLEESFDRVKPPFSRSIRRSRLLADIVDDLNVSRTQYNLNIYSTMQRQQHYLQGWPLQIKFHNEDDAIDEGGPSKELITVAIQKFVRDCNFITDRKKVSSSSSSSSSSSKTKTKNKVEVDDHLRLFQMTQSKMSFQPDPAASLICPDDTIRQNAFRAAGEICGTAIWNNVPIMRPSLFFCRRILYHSRTIRLRVVRPRDSLTIGDKCIWPVSFLKYANDQDAGVTFALRRVPPPLSIQRKSDFIQKKKQTFCETAMNEEKKISTRTTTITNSTTTNTTTTNLIYGKPPTKWWSCTVIEYDYGYSILSTQWGDVGGNSEHSKVRQYNDINEALKRSITKMKSKINKGYIKYTLNNDSFEKFKKNTSSTNSTTSTKNAEKAVDGFVLLHVGTHSEYRDTKIDNSSGRSGDGGSSSSGVDEQTCELPVWIMNELLLKENDVIEIEKVSLLSGSHVKIKLPFRLHEMDDEEFNLLQHCIHQHFIEFYDTLTEGTKIPLLWGEIFIFIEIIAVYTKSRNGQRQQLDAVNIRRSEVVNNLTYDFVPNDYDVKTEQGKKEEIQKETKDNEYDELGNDTETQELVKIFGLTPDQGVTLTSDNSNNEIKEDNDLTLIDGITSGLNKLKHYAEQIKFSPGSNSFRFMVRVKDYLEQSDPDMNWLLTFEQILKGEVDMFNYIDEYESARWIDPLSRIDEDEIPMMMRFSSAQDDQKGIAYSLLPNGNKIKVNKENQVRYLDLWLRHKLESEIDESTRWFVEGLKNVIPLGLLNIFNPNELQILLSGQPFLNDDNSTILNTFLNDHIVYQMDNNAPIIQYFKEAIRRFTPNERSMVFRFWTGMTSLPPGGLDCLHPKCTIELSTSSTEMLPLATTCYNLLVIPEYNSVEVLMEKLRKGCEYGMRFGRY